MLLPFLLLHILDARHAEQLSFDLLNSLEADRVELSVLLT